MKEDFNAMQKSRGTKIMLDLYGLTFATPDRSAYSIKELKRGKIEKKKTLRKNIRHSIRRLLFIYIYINV
jgi:hypothetical protein